MKLIQMLVLLGFIVIAINLNSSQNSERWNLKSTHSRMVIDSLRLLKASDSNVKAKRGKSQTITFQMTNQENGIHVEIIPKVFNSKVSSNEKSVGNYNLKGKNLVIYLPLNKLSTNSKTDSTKHTVVYENPVQHSFLESAKSTNEINTNTAILTDDMKKNLKKSFILNRMRNRKNQIVNKESVNNTDKALFLNETEFVVENPLTDKVINRSKLKGLEFMILNSKNDLEVNNQKLERDKFQINTNTTNNRKMNLPKRVEIFEINGGEK